MVGIVEVAPQENRKQGEYYISRDCVSRNVSQGTFTPLESSGDDRRTFILTSDLMGETYDYRQNTTNP